MPDDAVGRATAEARAAAEEESAFSHPAVDPDVSLAYGDDPDQVIDFYAPREVVAPGAVWCPWSSSCTAGRGGRATTGTM